MAQSQSLWKRFTGSQVFWPLVALGLIMLFNAIFTPGFFKLEIKDGHLFGTLIDIINRGAPLMVLAIGMTMVIATAGVDLSVGAVIAISAAMATVLINPALGKQLIASDKLVQDVTATPLPLVIMAALLVSRCAGCGMACWSPGATSSPWWPRWC
jgi:galactofuranose transport system permease protein